MIFYLVLESDKSCQHTGNDIDFVELATDHFGV